MSNELIPRATIEEMVGHRNKAIALYKAAFAKIAEADEAMKAAGAAREPFHAEVYADDRVAEIEAFKSAVKLPDAEQFMHVAERLTDIQFWTWLVQKGDLQRLMDIEAKKQLESQLAYRALRWNPRSSRNELIDDDEAAKSFPPVTVDNVVATIQHFAGDADMIFKRGVANAFSKLDRRFRSHDGFKIGTRLIVDRLFSSWGSGDSLNYSTYGGRFDTLQDIERAFAVLDGRPGESFRSAAWAIEQATRGFRHNASQQFEVTCAYFKIRCFKNGNAHLWMTRPELVRKVNKLLAEYYGEVVGDAKAKEDHFRKTGAPLAKRDFDLFPTPDAVAEKVISAAGLHQYVAKGEPTPPSLRVLEPSAGYGNLAIRAVAAGCRVDCVEIHADRASGLRSLQGIGELYLADFLKLRPNPVYDRVIMNPPFTGERDIDHVMHAMKFLKPGGYLVSVMSAGTEFRETNKAIAFREMAAKNAGRDRWSRNRWFEDLPERSFAEHGTNVNTIIVSLRAPDAPAARAAA